jgi:hypothetical protein
LFLPLLIFLRSKCSHFCRQTTLPRFCSAPLYTRARAAALTRFLRSGCRLALSSAACRPQLEALRTWLWWLGVNSINHTIAFSLFIPQRSDCRCIPHPATRHRLRITASHIRSSKEFAHVRRLLCDSSRPPLRPRRHHRQARPTSPSTVIPFPSASRLPLMRATAASKSVDHHAHKICGSVTAAFCARSSCSAAAAPCISNYVAVAPWRRQQQDDRGRRSLFASLAAASTGLWSQDRIMIFADYDSPSGWH